MRIGFFGDSFVAGIGDPSGSGWVGRLADACGFTAVNYGVGGDTSADVLDRWRKQADADKLDRLVFSFGANDCLLTERKRITVGQVDRLKNAKAIMMAARVHWPVLFISPLPIAGDSAATNRIGEMARQLATVAQINGAAYVNIFSEVKDNPEWTGEALAADGAHPAAGGYAHVAELIKDHPAWQGWLGA